MSTEAKAAGITPPLESSTVVVLAGNTTAQRFKIPSAWRKEYFSVEADGVNVYVAFGGASVAADLTGTTTLDAEAIDTYDGGECRKVADGSEKHWDLSKITPWEKDLYVSFDCDATAGYIRLGPTSGTVKGTL